MLGGQRQRLIERVCVQRLRSAEHRRERLNGGSDNVVIRLLRRERAAGGLRVEATHPGSGICRPEALFHDARPDFARGAIFGDFFEEVVVGIEKETEAGRKLVHAHARPRYPLHVFDPVAERKGQLLHSRRAGFADVIAADGYRVPTRHFTRPEDDRIHHQAHGRRGRKNVFLLRDVFLQDVVLRGPGNLFPVGALLFGRHQVRRPNHRRRGVDSHRGRDRLERKAGKQRFHVGERAYGHAAFADFALGERVVGVVTHQRR